VLEAVKVSPDNGGACCKVAVTANLDSSRARWRERSQVRDEETNLQIKQRSLRRKKDAPPCLNFLTRKAPYKGLGADSEEKHEPVGDIDTVVVDSLKALDLERPIREAGRYRRLTWPAGLVPLAAADLAPRFVCPDRLSTRKSARTSTRFGRGPPGGVTQ